MNDEPQTAAEVRALALLVHRKRQAAFRPAPVRRQAAFWTTHGTVPLYRFQHGMAGRAESYAGLKVIAAALRAFGLARHEFIAARRERELVRRRQACMWVMYHHTKLSLPSIGRLLGGKDHTTVMHGIHKVEAEPDMYEGYVARIFAELEITP